jgi:hypothetical protein
MARSGFLAPSSSNVVPQATQSKVGRKTFTHDGRTLLQIPGTQSDHRRRQAVNSDPTSSLLPSDIPPDAAVYLTDYQDRRSRLTTFFRIVMLIPHLIWLALWGFAASFAVIAAWFALVFTGRYPLALYEFIAHYVRYSTFVNSYSYLITDPFPPFNGEPDTHYPARILIGPPKERYSRAKTFFRLILIIPFVICAYGFALIAELANFAAWFVIVITGKQPRSLHDLTVLGLSYVVRLNTYAYLLTEDWPTKFTDQAVNESLAAQLDAPATQPEQLQQSDDQSQ